VDLYALPPEDFTAARDAAAKEDKSLKALRRPSVSAWVVNTLVREQPDLLGQLVDLGAALREATQARQGEQLRELTEQRHQLVQAVTDQAVQLVGRDITPPVRTEVAQTLEAAMADPASAEAVQSGSLVRALSYAGFGAVDLDGAVAPVAKAPTEASPPKGPSKRLQKLEAAALEAQGRLDDAVRVAERTARAHEAAAADSERAEAEVTSAQQRVDEVRAQLKEAERALQETRSRHAKAAKELDDLTRKAERATSAVAEAQDAWDRARKALDEARRS
jgi:hypothetical protein